MNLTPEKDTNLYQQPEKRRRKPRVYNGSQNGKWLINGNYTEGSASVYPVSENGMIQPFVQNFQFSEGSVNPGRQGSAHIHSTVFSPDYNYVFMPDLGADKIRAYQFDQDKKSH